MSDFVISLQDIVDTHTVFEPDQVLTSAQLNGVTDYLDDQQRLTRVDLIGVGIGCGLGLGFVPGKVVTVSRGVGVTTDGDLMRLDENASFTRYRRYDSAAPRYSRFYTGGTRIPLYELIPADAPQDPDIHPLSQFDANEGRLLANLVALLHMQSYHKDDDLCSGTDCDNHGQGAINALKVLLTSQNGATELVEKMNQKTTSEAARKLNPAVAARPMLAGVSAVGDLVNRYEKACREIEKTLDNALGTMYEHCVDLLAPVFAVDPAARWAAELRRIRAAVPASGIQYYYDFLKDLVETYNAFCGLFGDDAVCCPDVADFPKHLLLGNLASGTATGENRTGFYPSPMIGGVRERRAHARFLARKIDVLIGAFQLPRQGPNVEIRITPSAAENRSLEERAIPYYYQAAKPVLVQPAWNYALARRGRELDNYCYYAPDYNGGGGSAAPLEMQIGRFDSFRIEGHLGWDVGNARGNLDAQIQKYDLPIHLAAVQLAGANVSVFPFPRPLSDLDHFRDLMRADLALQLADAADFAGRFAGQVAEAVRAGTISDADNRGVPVEATARSKSAAIAEHAKKAVAKLSKPEAGQPAAWHEDVRALNQATAELKEGLAGVSRNLFASPLDSVIDGPAGRWAAWLDAMIEEREKEDARNARFPDYLRRHPGFEHFGGVARGGTFVLVYDEKGTVIADFMLPYACCQPYGYTAVPPVKIPPLKPPAFIEKPIWLTPQVDKPWLTKVAGDLREETRLDKQYFEGFKESISVLGGIVLGGGKGGTGEPAIATHVTGYLRAMKEVNRVQAELATPRLTPERQRALAAELSKAQAQAADAEKALRALGLG